MSVNEICTEHYNNDTTRYPSVVQREVGNSFGDGVASLQLETFIGVRLSDDAGAEKIRETVARCFGGFEALRGHVAAGQLKGAPHGRATATGQGGQLADGRSQHQHI